MAKPDLRVGTIDGVPAVWCPAEGLCSVGLVFRVGQLDERLPQRGWTHLIEHLALHHLKNESFAFNGTTGWSTTSFLAKGTAAEAATFLEGVCEKLTSLPFEEMKREALVLDTEQCQRGVTPASHVLMNVYGTEGPGVFAYPEYGLKRLDVDEIDAWRERYFTKANAYIWFCGPTPIPNVRLDLPQGGGRQQVVKYEAIEKLPAWINVSASQVTLTAEMPDAPAVGAMLRILERRMSERLRNERGLSYNVSSTRITSGCDTDMVILTADHREGDAGAVQEIMAEEIHDLLRRTVTHPELDAWATPIERFFNFESDASAALASAWAEKSLLDAKTSSPSEVLAAIRSVTPDDVHDCVSQFVEKVAWGMPHGSSVTDCRVRSVDATSPWRSEGDLFLRVLDLTDSGGATGMIVCDEGVSLAWGSNRQASVRFDSLAIAVHEDRVLRLIDRSGFAVTVDPVAWVEGERLLTSIVSRCPADRLIRSVDAEHGTPAPNGPGTTSTNDVFVPHDAIAHWKISTEPVPGDQKLLAVGMPGPTPNIKPVPKIAAPHPSNITLPVSSRDWALARAGSFGSLAPFVIVLALLLVIAGSDVFAGPLLIVAVIMLLLSKFRPFRPISTGPDGVVVRCSTPALSYRLRKATLISVWQAADGARAPINPSPESYYAVSAASPRALAILNAVDTKSSTAFLEAFLAATADEQIAVILDACDRPDGDRKVLALAGTLGDTAPANTIRGFVAIGTGSKARGQGFAHTVSDQGARMYLDCLRDAEALFRRATWQAPHFVAARIGLVMNARGLGIPVAERVRRYEDVVALEPDNFAAAAQHLQNIAPKWGGSDQAMLAFGQDLLERFGVNHPLAGIAAMAHLETAIGGSESPEARIVKGAASVRRQIVDGLAVTLETAPSAAALRGLNMAVAAAWVHQEQSTVTRGFSVLRGRLTATPWSYFPSGPQQSANVLTTGPQSSKKKDFRRPATPQTF